MVASTVRQPKTYEDYLHTPDDGQRYELIDGEIVVSPSGTKRHQYISGRLSSWLFLYVEQHGLGKVFSAPMDVRLDRDLVVQPDIVFVRKGSPADNPDDQIIVGAPALAVEILSPSTAVRDLNRKREIYEHYGVEEYWIIDPERKTLTAFTLGESGYSPVRSLAGNLRSRSIPGFVVDLTALFQDIF